MLNDTEERTIISEVLNSADNWNMDANRLVLRYLDPYIQNGLDAILDDGYLLYLKDVEDEMMDFLKAHITDDDALNMAIADNYGNGQMKVQIIQRLKTILLEKYKDVAPVPKRKISEYIQYADSKKTREEFEKCYHEYVRGVQELQDVALDLLEKMKMGKQTDEIKTKGAVLTIFVNLLESLKDKEFFKSLTYETAMPTTKLFYQEIFLSEDAERVLNQVLEQTTHSLLDSKAEKKHYSLEDIYQSIPNDIISYELLENEEIDPNCVAWDDPFFQSFYQLVLRFYPDEKGSEQLQQKVYYFLIEKVASFQNEFMKYFNDNDFDDEIEFLYTKERPIRRH